MPAGGKVQRGKSSLISEVGCCAVICGTGRGLLLLVLKSLALAPIGVAASVDLDDVEDNQLDDGSDACDQEDYADPPMPNVCCEHEDNRSEYNPNGGYC